MYMCWGICSLILERKQAIMNEYRELTRKMKDVCWLAYIKHCIHKREWTRKLRLAPILDWCGDRVDTSSQILIPESLALKGLCKQLSWCTLEPLDVYSSPDTSTPANPPRSLFAGTGQGWRFCDPGSGEVGGLTRSRILVPWNCCCWRCCPMTISPK